MRPADSWEERMYIRRALLHLARPLSHFGEFHDSPLRQLWAVRDLPGLHMEHRVSFLVSKSSQLYIPLFIQRAMKSACSNSLHSRNAGYLNGIGLLHQSDSSKGCFRSAMRGQPRTLRAFTSRRITSRSLHVHAAAATYSKETPHLQLATAKLSRFGFMA
jgi:hypothetical protein